MDLLISLSHVLAYLSLAFAIAIPQFRRPAVAIMAAVAVLTGITAMTGDSPRTLETVHTYAGFEGSAMEVSMVSFPTGSFTADGWQWAMPFAGFVRAVDYCPIDAQGAHGPEPMDPANAVCVDRPRDVAG